MAAASLLPSSLISVQPRREQLVLFSSCCPPSSSSSSRSKPGRSISLLSASTNVNLPRSLVRSANTSPSSTTASSETLKPEIELEFIGPKAREDGSYPVEKARAVSGEKLLRNIMLDNKIELYAAYGKVMNCGGGGSCGTCIVEIIDGKDLLNKRTDTEQRYLKKKPESWRLACQTIVGNKENTGKVIVQQLPQWKK